MEPAFFENQLDFRKWFADNHQSAPEIIVGFWKVGSGKPSMTWPEAVDQALCYGWIDGIRRSLGPESYSVRFTPRRANSIWSAVNVAKVAELTKKGLMQPAGSAAYALKKESSVYAYENSPQELPPDLESEFKSNKKAWEFFTSQPAWYRRTAIYRVVSAKREATRRRRFEKLMAASEKGERT